MTTPHTGAPATVRAQLADFVGRRAAMLAEGYQRDDSRSVATLARIRRASGPVGFAATDADVWDVLDGMPDALMGRGDDPSTAEQAAMTTLVLFAVHQQSRADAAMHVSGRDHSLGRAIGALSRAADAPGVERRFRALIRAENLTQASNPLRGLVNQLRSARIPLDYSRLATDLYQMQQPGGAHPVRMRWVRDFHRSPPVTPEPAQTDSSGEPA